MQELAFYCVCDRKHFLGLVALVNSLRLQRYEDRVYALDCGFEPWQRAVLAQDDDVVVVEADSETHPIFLKTVLPLAHPASTMVVVDVDVILTGRLDELVKRVRSSGKAVFFSDPYNNSIGRFYPAWERLGFGKPIQHAYVASGQMLLPAGNGLRTLGLWAQGLQRLLDDPTLIAAGDSPEGNAFFYPDMDVLNALIGAAIPIDSFMVAPASSTAYWPFEGLRISDAARLLVESSDGPPPILLHHILAKPWSGLVAPNPYTRLLTRLLTGQDVPLRVPTRRIPHSLRTGVAGAIARPYVAARVRAHRTLRGKLGIRPRLARRYPRILKSRYHYRTGSRLGS